MHTAAKLARFGDRMVSIFAAALILLMLLYGGYSLWDTAMVFQGAFLDSDLLQFKPAAGDPDSNPTLQELQAINPDVCGWLTIDEMIDEAVVQRDNAYYLNRDYRGYHNVNGAIFLEETCDLSTRPYTLMLYGHNMKTGAMFGSLRNYENMTYYRNNPFITFDTAYEDGRYVIFAVSTVSLDRLDDRYVDFAKLNADWIDQRSEALDALMSCSLYRTAPDVTPQDQLLLLITCVDDDEERRVVAARRLRPDETEESLAKAIEATTKR